jgi:fibronectin type 3 domain-containing protein
MADEPSVLYRRPFVLVLALAFALACVGMVALQQHTAGDDTPGGTGRSESAARPRTPAAPSRIAPGDSRATQAAKLHHAAQAKLAELQHLSGVAPMRAVLGHRFDRGARITGAGVTVAAVPVDARAAARTSDSHGTVTYVDAWPGVDVVQEPDRSWLKESLVLRPGTLGAARRGSYAFHLNGRAVPSLTSTGDVTFRDGRVPIALRIPAPRAVDARGRILPASATRYALAGRLLTLKIALPATAAFPVTVDPTFAMSQGADHVIGTDAFDSAPARHGRDPYAFMQPAPVATDGTRVLVGDYYDTSARVSIFNSFPTANATPQDSTWSGVRTQPGGIWTNGTKALVSDISSHRVLAFDAFNGVISHVLGQPSISGYQQNFGGRGANTMNQPYKVWSDGTRIAVADRGNNRVLIWNSWPTSDGAPADVVLGQPDASSGDANRGGSPAANTLRTPRGVYSDGTRFYVADTDNHRVLIWDSFPTTTGQAADRILGQSAMNRRTCNDGALASKVMMCSPTSVQGDGTHLAVADYSNSRVLLWNTPPVGDAQPANVIVGSTRGRSSTQFWAPEDAAFVGSKLAVSDPTNNRVLLWNTLPTSDAEPAQYAMGQEDLTSGGMMGNRGDSWYNIMGMDYDALGRLWVAHGHEEFLTRYPATLPAIGGVADYSTGSPVPGQPAQTSATDRMPAWSPRDLNVSDDGKLIATQASTMSRVTWNNTTPATNPPPIYDGALGQPDVSSGGDNRSGAPSANTLYAPTTGDWDGSHFAVADTGNNRVLIWNSMPTTGAPADVVIGQPDFTTTSPNTGGVSANSLYSPQSVRLSGGKLYVADTLNHRILVWNSIPSEDHAAADVVLGQTTMFSNNSGTSATSLYVPTEVDIDEGMLAVADSYNRRVLLWDTVPTVNGAAADRVIGQASMGANSCTTLRAGLCYPTYIALRDGRLAVNDNGYRIVIYDDVAAPTISDIAAVVAGERATVSWTTDEDATSTLVWDTSPHALANEYAFSSNPAGRGRAHAVSAEPLVSGTTYFYRVVSVDARGNTSVSAEGTIAALNATHLVGSDTFAADATIDEAQPDHNYGAEDDLVIGGSGGARARALLRFDLDQLPTNATITSATLTLHQTDAGSGTTPTIDALRATSAWEEGSGAGTLEASGTTWNSPDGIDPWSSAGGDAGVVVASASAPATAPAAMQLDVTTQVGRWLTGTDDQDGLLLEMSPEGTGETRRFASSEHADPDLRPTLHIEWSGRDSSPPRIANIHTQLISSSSVRITWTSDEMTSSMLEYGTTTSYGTQISDPAASNSHEVIVDDLAPSTTYHVRVTATDAQGNYVPSSDVVFRTSYRVHIVAEDATLREDLPARNSGGHGVFVVGNMNGSWQRARAALKFDMSSIPAAAVIRSASAKLVVARQAAASTLPLTASALDADFIEGTGNPPVGPSVATSGFSTSVPEPLLSSAERHMLLTSTGWWQFTGQPDVWRSSFMTHRRSGDGFGFSSDATFGRFAWGKSGVSLIDDGALAWSAGFQDDSSRVEVASYAAGDDAATALGLLTFPDGVNYLPSVAVGSDGYVWVKGEAPNGDIWVARSSAPRNPAAWDAPVKVTTQTAPAHAMLIALTGGDMLLIAQDGGQLMSHRWNGTAWSGAAPITSDAELPATWATRTSFAGVPDGSGGAWLTYVVAGGGAKAVHYAAGVWSAPESVAASARAVAITRDRNGDEPIVFWQDATALLEARYTSGAWSAPVTLPVTLPATPTQLASTPPSDEAVGITWSVANGSGFDVRWYGLTLGKPADGVTWNTSDNATPWSTPGAADGSPAIATPTAPGDIGGVMDFDLTSVANDWYTGATANHGFVLRATSEVPALNDWKAFYSSEAVNPSVRPTLIVDYDLATATFTQPTSATAWRSSSNQYLRWQVTGSGITQAEIRYSSDDGATWPFLVDAAAPNTGSYEWTTPPAEGTYRVQIQAKNALGDVIAIGESDPFVIDDTPPDPVIDVAAPTPSNAAALTWTEPVDYGGAGMANGSYRVYRSTSSGVLGSRIATVPNAFYDDSSPLADGTYYYTTIPVDAAGNAQLVGNNQVGVAHDASQPNAVVDLSGPTLTNGAAALSWSAVADVGLAGMGTYRVYRSASNGVLGTLVGTVGSTSTSDTPPSDGTWYYTVTPVDLAGNVRASGNNQITVVADTVPPSGTSINVNSSAAWTGSSTVTAALAATGAAEFEVSEDAAFTSATWQPMAASTSVVLSASDGNHVVYARYRDAAGNVSASVSDGINRDTTAPAAMSSLSIPSPAAAVNLTWGAGTDGSGSGVDHYAIYRSASSGTLGSSIATSTGTSRSDTPPSDGAWYYTVRAVDLVGNERSSGDLQVAVVYDTLAPSAVASTAVTQSPTAAPVALTWSAASDATTSVASYRVYRSATAGVLGSLVTTVATTATTNTPPSDGSWYYTVQAVDAAGNEQGVGNTQVSAVYDATAPAVVSDASIAVSPSNSPLSLTWSASSDATTSVASYHVYRSTSSGTLGPQIADPASTSLLDTPPADGTYYYTVRAVDVVGNERTTGDVQVSGVYDTTAPTPSPMSGTAIADSPTQITWTADVAADAHGLHATPYSIDTGTAAWQASRVVVASGLTANTQYTRTVRARDAAGNVRTGSIARFTLTAAPDTPGVTAADWTAGDGNRFDVSWSAPASGADTYHLRSSADGYATVIASTSSTSRSFTSIPGGTTITYRICGVNADGAEETTCTSAAGSTPPDGPATASTTNVSTVGADVDWPDVVGASQYALTVYGDASCTAQVATFAAIAASNYALTTLQLDRRYTYRVQAYGGSGAYGAPGPCEELDSASRRTSVNVSLDSATSDLGHALTGEAMTGSSTVTVSTDGSDGYSIQAAVDHQPTKGGDVIPATIAGTPAAPAPWAGTGFGITVVSATGLQPKWGAGTKWAALTSTPTQIHDTGAVLTPGSVIDTATTIGYRISVPAAQPAGAYALSLDYTVIPHA